MRVPSSVNLLTSSKDALLIEYSPKCQQCTLGHRDRHRALCFAQFRHCKLLEGVPVREFFFSTFAAEGPSVYLGAYGELDQQFEVPTEMSIALRPHTLLFNFQAQ
jgi:hypothetical protein